MRWPGSGSSDAATTRRKLPIQTEDVVLFVWFAIGEEMVTRLLRAGMGQDLPAYLSAGSHPLVGLAMIAAYALAIVALLTRETGVDYAANLADRGRALAIWARAPMLLSLSIIGDAGLEQLGVRSGDAMLVIAVGSCGISAMFLPKLPPLPGTVRRILLAPVVFAGALWFSGIFDPTFEQLDAASLFEGTPEAKFGVFVTVMLLFAASAFWAAFVLAPRVVGETRTRLGVWIVRYVAFLGAVVFGILRGGAPSG